MDRNSTKSFFVTVPEGATALQVNLSGIATGSQTRWTAINPWGVPVDPTSTPFCYTNYSDPSDTSPCKPRSVRTRTRSRACGSSRWSRGVRRRR